MPLLESGSQDIKTESYSKKKNKPPAKKKKPGSFIVSTGLIILTEGEKIMSWKLCVVFCLLFFF